MTRIYQLAVIILAVVVVTNSCGQAAPPAKALAPVQVPPIGPTTVTKVLRLNDGSIILIVDGLNFYALGKDGGQPPTLVPITQVVYVTDPPNPGPGPIPPPGPPPLPPPVVLTERAKAIKAAADNVKGDPNRAGTAQALADLYRQLAAMQRAGQFADVASLQLATKTNTDTLLAGRNVTAQWLGVRDQLSTYWTILVATGGDFAALLDEAASGLEASAPRAKFSPAVIDDIRQSIQAAHAIVQAGVNQ